METKNHECYVSIEVAKLLKEVGFDWKCKCVYNDGKLCIWYEPKSNDWWKCQSDTYAAPTIEVAHRWLREVKNISVEVKTNRWINRYQDGKYTVSYIHELWSIDTSIVPNKEDKFIRYTIDCAYNIEFQTYEEALEAGIKKALEIILEKGK